MGSKRSDSWVKVKKDYLEGCGDSLDLVPIAAWWGNGRKTGWLSPYLMACIDSETGEYQSVCKVMSGFSDKFYKESLAFYTEPNQNRLLHNTAKKKNGANNQNLSNPNSNVNCPLDISTSLTPDVWLVPSEVWEIKGADMTVSPVHHAALGLCHEDRGISLRFPRFVRKRPDK